MGARRLILVALSSLVLLHTLPSPARADDEAARYAQRESETPRLAEFRGGSCCWDPGPWIILLIPLAVVCLPFYLLYKGGEALFDLCAPAPTPYVPKPKAPPKPAPAPVPVPTCGG